MGETEPEQLHSVSRGEEGQDKKGSKWWGGAGTRSGQVAGECEQSAEGQVPGVQASAESKKQGE